MGVSLRTNIAAIQTQRRLSDGTRALGQSFERLASGLRINHAGDDAAGLAISESLKADTRVFNQGVRNLNDGISLLSIADETIGELSNIVIRIKELAEQSSNGIYGSSQRKALDAEAQALSKEFNRVAQSTTFNGKSVLTADFGSLTLQGGYGANGGIQSSLGGAVGSGGFAAPATYNVSSGRKMATSDLNGDGFLDLVSASVASATVQLGVGDGTFGTAVSYAMESSGTDAVTLNDVNDDGIMDIVTSGYSGATARATIRLGSGDGTFGAALSYQMSGGEAFGLNLADLNNDGFLDIVTAGSGSGATTSIRLGTGNGTFGGIVSYSTVGSFGLEVGIADFNNDSILDLVTLTNNTGGFVSYRQGVGNGTFGASTVLSMNSTGDSGMTVADVNGDGIPDILSSGYAGGGSVAIRFGQSNGTFSNVLSLGFNAGYGNGLTTGDLNGDGILDIIVAASDGGSASQISYRLGQGGGTFGAAISVATNAGSSAFGITAGDFNGDGVQDISTIAFGGGGVAVLNAQTLSGVSAILPFKLTTRAGALQALAPLDRKLAQLANQRGTIGAFQSRVTTAVNMLTVSSENFSTAQSRIADVDVAEEAAKLTRGKILQQSAAAILAQANLQPRIALDLLPGGKASK